MKDKDKLIHGAIQRTFVLLTKGPMLAHKALGLGKTFELEVTEQAQYRQLCG